MKLYYAKGACSLAVRIVMHELKIPCKYESVDLKLKKTETGADYNQINPKGSVPAIQLDTGEILTENAVIQQYLADKYNATTLLPEVGDFNRYKALEWLNYVSTDMHKGCTPLFNAKIPQALKDEIFVPNLKGRLDFLEAHLSKSPYLLDHYTLADGYLFVILFWLPHFKIELANWENLYRYYNQLKNRASFH